MDYKTAEAAILEVANFICPEDNYDDILSTSIDEIFCTYNEDKILLGENYFVHPVTSYGGEGQGDEYWEVLKVVDKNTLEKAYVKREGWYASYSGHEWAKAYLVEPKEVMVTEYHKVGSPKENPPASL